MFQFFLHVHPIIQAFLGGIFAFLFTVLGAGIVFFFRKVNQRTMNIMLATSAGIMLAAAFFSLLNPAIEIANEIHQDILFVLFGFLFGGLFLLLCNKFLSDTSIQDISSFRKCALLFTSITLHNIPEGLAIGVAFGSILYGNPVISAISLTIGIAIQNFPEGAAISLPMRNNGSSCIHSFLFGTVSGLVEPIASIIGALLILKINIIMPFILSFAAGAMIYVTCLELLPDCLSNKNKDLMIFILLVGFSIMMILEVLLG